jgi:hypothetical protein
VLRFTEIVAAATIPFLSGVAGDSFPIKIAIGALGVFVAVVAPVLGLLHLQEHWIVYRATAESLRREKFLFLTQTEPYDKGNAFHLLVQRIEERIVLEIPKSGLSTFASRFSRSKRLGPPRHKFHHAPLQNRLLTKRHIVAICYFS